ncbi:hypothetical protein Celaphus_00017644, partial [Cervus elaphus hippelaphus]
VVRGYIHADDPVKFLERIKHNVNKPMIKMQQNKLKHFLTVCLVLLNCLLSATHTEYAYGSRRDESERPSPTSARPQHAFRWDGRWGSSGTTHAEPDERPDAWAQPYAYAGTWTQST